MLGGGIVERGTGNVCSAEFNLLYRWHSTLSQADEKWFTDILCEKAGGKPVDQLTREDFINVRCSRQSRQS